MEEMKKWIEKSFRSQLYENNGFVKRSKYK